MAHGAGTFVEYERDVLSLVAATLRADTAFFVRTDGLGAGALSIRKNVARACRDRWGKYRDELSPVFDDALKRDGVAVDVEVLGDELRRTCVFREFMAPHAGRCTLIGIVALGEDILGTIAMGRTKGAFVTRDREALVSLLPALSVCEAAMRRRSETWANLTEREREIVRGLRLGYTNGEIATSLGTSVNTVRNQMRSIFKKLGATTRAEAVALSLGHGAHGGSSR